MGGWSGGRLLGTGGSTLLTSHSSGGRSPHATFYAPTGPRHLVCNGSFTQEDPIGIAGGLNLYGYANGDPINFSDPFGLCPWPPSSCFGRAGVDLAAGFAPGLSTGVDVTTVLSGTNPITGEQVGALGRGLALAGALTPVTGGQLRGAGRILEGLFERFGKAATDVVENGVRRTEFGLDDGSKLIFRGPETHPIVRGGDPITHYNVEVHAPTGVPGRFRQIENTHLDPDGRVINP